MNSGVGEASHAAPIEKSRLRAHRDEAPGDPPGRGLGQRPRDRRAVRHPDRADGQGAAAPGAPRPRDLAPGHARRLPAGPRRLDHLCRRHHPGDRRAADRHRLLDRGGELRPVREVQRPRPAVAHPRAHPLGARDVLAAGDLVRSARDADDRDHGADGFTDDSDRLAAAICHGHDAITDSNVIRNAEARLPRLSRHDPGRSSRARGDAAVLHRGLRQPGEPPARVRVEGAGSGRSARAARWRRSSARPAREIVFTSGATESNNLAIKGAAQCVPRPGRSPRHGGDRAQVGARFVQEARARGLARHVARRRRATASSASTSCGRRSPTRPCSSR